MTMALSALILDKRGPLGIGEIGMGRAVGAEIQLLTIFPFLKDKRIYNKLYLL